MPSSSRGPRPDTWMPLYIGDYTRDTMHLTTEQHGAYLLLIFAYWTRGALPDDDAELGAITRLHPMRWRQQRPKLERFFLIDGGWWMHKRVEAERARAEAITNERREAGKRGGKAKAKHWQKPSKELANGWQNSSKPVANDVANAWQKGRPSHPQEESKEEAIKRGAK